MACHAPRCIDYLPHAVTLSIAEVVSHLTALVERFQSQNVSRAEIQDVYVVADAGPVEGVVVGPENLNRVTLSKWHLKGERNEVRFRAVRLAANSFTLVVEHRAAGVEVAEYTVL